MASLLAKTSAWAVSGLDFILLSCHPFPVIVEDPKIWIGLNFKIVPTDLGFLKHTKGERQQLPDVSNILY